MRKFLYALCLLVLPILAWAQTGVYQTKPAMQTEINTNLPDNTTGAITPSILRGVLSDMLQSWQQVSNQFAGVSAVTTSSTTFLGFQGLYNSNETLVQVPSSITGSARSLQVITTADPGTANTISVTFQIAGAPTSLTCTITGTGVAGGKTCSDLTHNPIFSGGQLLDVKFIASAISPTGLSLSIGMDNQP